MNPLLFARRSPGASTCVAIGAFDGTTVGEFQPHREILWIGNEAASQPPVSHPRIHRLTLDRPGAELATTVQQFIRRSARHLPSLLISREVLGEDADRYSEVIELVHGALDQQHRARQTREKDGFRWQAHLLENLGRYARQRVPESWRDALRGTPAFICGAGPSLDVSGACLAAHAAGAIVFSADSALRALARRGVQADFAVSIDVAKAPEKCLPGNLLPARTILSAVSPPGWTKVPALATSTFFVSSNQLTLDWLVPQGIARTPLAATENCGSTAVELARFLGCAPIYLFGLDLALDAANSGRRHHEGVDATIYTDSGFDAAQQHPLVPGNYTDRVPTFAPNDWRALDERLARWPAGLVVNVNDRGARFSNTTLVHPREFDFHAGGVAKATALARLASADAHAPITAFQTRLRGIGERTAAEIARIRAALANQGVDAAVSRLRKLFADQDTAQAFGAFSLKVLPYLLPPTEGDRTSWSTLLDELGELAEFAKGVQP